MHCVNHALRKLSSLTRKRRYHATRAVTYRLIEVFDIESKLDHALSLHVRSKQIFLVSFDDIAQKLSVSMLCVIIIR